MGVNVIDHVLERLKEVKRRGKGWTALCPAHDDKNPSLGISEAADGKVLVKCQSQGCSFSQIASALDLKESDFFPEQNRDRIDQAGADALLTNRGLRPETIRYFKIVANVESQSWEFPLGKAGGTKYKRFVRTGKFDYWVSKGTKHQIYHFGPCKGKSDVWMVEGEPDVWIAHQAGLAAFTFTGGAENPLQSHNIEEIKAASIGTINIVYDLDDPGRDGAAKVAASFRDAGIAHTVRVLPDSVGAKGDVTDLYGGVGCDDERFKVALAELCEALPPATVLTVRKEKEKDEKEKETKQTDDLLAMARKATKLFHDADGVAYASVAVDGHHETHILNPNGGSFKKWLRREFFKTYGSAPSTQPLKDAISTLEAIAEFDGIEAEVYLRIGQVDGNIYIDLCNENWEVVEVTPSGWNKISEPPIYFRRAPGARPLPVPTRGGKVDQLRDFINIETDDDFVLALVWLLAAMRPKGPFGVLSFAGEQGSAKSTAMRVVRSMFDPNKAPIRSAPHNEEDLIVAATHGWCLAYDNLSKLPVWLSDGLCRMATGGGLGKRRLYTSDDEVLFAGQRPVMCNSIEDIIDRDDLRDRSICLTLPTIPDNRRRDEATFWEEFESAQPAILGSLLTLLSKAMAQMPGVKLESSPRMADLARFGVAVERAAQWETGRFLEVYSRNRDEADAKAIEDNRIASLVRDLAKDEGVWTGTASSLLKRFNKEVGERVLRSKDWPQTAKGMGGRIRRAAPALRRVGIQIDYHRSGNARMITISADIPQSRQSTVTTVTPSQSQENRPIVNDGRVTVGEGNDPTVIQPSPSEASKNGHNDGNDGNDGCLQPYTVDAQVELGVDDYSMEERLAIIEEGSS